MALAVVQIILFCLGLALGSFLHVLASRYDPERFLLNHGTLGGRSHCPHCKKTLRWYELVPLLSFLVQRGRCRGCSAVIGWNYVWAELASGLILTFVPFIVLTAAGGPLSAALWTLAFLILLLITLIDLRLQMIPDELSIALLLIALAITALGAGATGGLWLANLATAAAAAAFFGTLIVLTRGRGMGMGDVKLTFAIGFLFGWPYTLLLIMLAFIIGAVVGVALVARGVKKLKSTVPFGPFLALAAAVVFFCGPAILQSWYNLMV